MPPRRSIRELISLPFIQKSAVFQIGSVGAMLIQAAAGVVLARVLGPDQYGRYALIMSLAAIGSVFLGAGATDAIAPVASRAHHAGDNQGVRDTFSFLGSFVLVTALGVSLLGLLLLPFFAGKLYGDTVVGWYGAIVLAAAAISTLLFAPLQLGLQVVGKIKRLSVLTFSDQVVRQGLVIVFALGGLGIGAAIGHLIGAFIVLLIAGMFWHFLLREGAPLPGLPAFWKETPTGGRKNIAPTLWVLADRNLAMLYGAAPVAVAALFLTNNDLSYFKIALGWIILALSVLNPVSILLNTELARIQIQEPKRLRSQFVRVSLVAVCVSTVVTLVAALIARPVFSLLYGGEYTAAVALVYWLIPMGSLFGLGIALGPMWRALNRVKVSIGINLVVLGIGIPLGMLGLRQWGVVGAVAMVTLWYTASHVASFWYLLGGLGGTGNRSASTL